MRLSSVKLLIFDEPTAALDPKTEHEIYQLFRPIATGKITLVINHRLALAKLVDRIFVLENGKIIETRTHERLTALGRLSSYVYETSRQPSVIGKRFLLITDHCFRLPIKYNNAIRTATPLVT